jgi:hypothetical protein
MASLTIGNIYAPPALATRRTASASELSGRPPEVPA